MIVLAATVLALAALVAFKGKRTLHERLHPRLYRRAGFPEERFPADDPARFNARTTRGYERMKGSSLVVCAITRDDAETLPLTIRRIERTGAAFRSYRVVIFENDSSDATPALLREWQDANPRVTVLSESAGSGLPADRFSRLAAFRNRYLEHLDTVPELDDVDFVLVVDMDLTGGWSLDGIASSVSESGWDAMASNSIGYHWLRRTYYDTAALRPRSALRRRWTDWLLGAAWQLRRGDPPVAVESAFGGLCLYRRAALRSRRYAGVSGGRPACEHVALHRDSGMRCFLNPGQITVIGTQPSRNGPQNRWTELVRRVFANW